MNQHKKAVNGSRILMLGMAYKKDIDDLRESPSLTIIELLREAGAEVLYNDPYFPTVGRGRHYNLNMTCTPLDNLEQYDCVLIVTDHSDYDYEDIVSKSQLVVDSRNATRASVLRRSFAAKNDPVQIHDRCLPLPLLLGRIRVQACPSLRIGIHWVAANRPKLFKRRKYVSRACVLITCIVAVHHALVPGANIGRRATAIFVARWANRIQPSWPIWKKSRRSRLYRSIFTANNSSMSPTWALRSRACPRSVPACTK